MNPYTPRIQTPPTKLPNPGMPPEGFPPIIGELGTYVPSYDKKPFLDNIVYKLPGKEKKEIVLPGKINPEIEDYKPTTLEQIIFN